jgi:hypothetical protein
MGGGGGEGCYPEVLDSHARGLTEEDPAQLKVHNESEDNENMTPLRRGVSCLTVLRRKGPRWRVT